MTTTGEVLIMPRGDGTGPLGKGTMTGRGRGFCISDKFNPKKPLPGKGQGPERGMGRGQASGQGRGQGPGQGQGSGQGRGR